MSNYFVGNHNHTFNQMTGVWPSSPADHAIVEYCTKAITKDQPMSTLDKVKAERNETRERLRIEQMYKDYDDVGLDQGEPGTVVRFVWEAKNHPYTYAALFVDDCWYVTGHTSPNGLATEDFVAWLIGKDVTAADLTFLDESS